MAAYASQLPVLFGAAEAMPAALRAYAEAVGGGEPAERILARRQLPGRVETVGWLARARPPVDALRAGGGAPTAQVGPEPATFQ